MCMHTHILLHIRVHKQTLTCTCTCGTHTKMHMHMLTHVHLAGQIGLLEDMKSFSTSAYIHCKNTYRPYRVNQTSVGCLKNVLIMTVTMIKSLIIIVDKIINMVPLDYTTNSYSVEEIMSYF